MARTATCSSALVAARGMGVAAEVIFQLLPPPTFATGDITIAGALEPAYQVGGDVFDFALNTPTLHVAIFDAVGHGLASSLVATIAINGYRNARRAGAALIDTYRHGGRPDRRAVRRQHVRHRSPRRTRHGNRGTAVGQRRTPAAPARSRRTCDPPSGVTTPAAVRARESGPSPATADRVPSSCNPATRCSFYTDGVVEARTSQGVDFGLERLIEFLERAEASGLPSRRNPAPTLPCRGRPPRRHPP